MFAIIDGSHPNETTTSLHPEQLKDLLAKCWSRQPEERPEVLDCLSIVESTLHFNGSDLAVRSEQYNNSSPASSTITGTSIRDVGLGVYNPDNGSGNDEVPIQPNTLGTTATTARPFSERLPPAALPHSLSSLPVMPSELTVTGSRMSDLGFGVFNSDNSSDDHAIAIERITPQTDTQVPPKPVAAPRLPQTPLSRPRMQSELTVTGRRLWKVVRNGFNLDNSDDDDAVPIKRNGLQAAAQLLPKPFYDQGLVQPPPSRSSTRSGSTITGRRIRKLGLRVFNPDNSSDDDASSIQGNAPQATARPLPKPPSVPGIAQGSHLGQRPPLQQLQLPMNASQSQPAGKSTLAPAPIRFNRPEPVNKLIITVTVDAESYVIVDVTGVKDALHIRDRVFSKLRIPGDDQRNYQIYRTELGAAALGSPVTDDQLMIYSEPKGTESTTKEYVERLWWRCGSKQQIEPIELFSHLAQWSPSKYDTSDGDAVTATPTPSAGQHLHTAATEREQAFEAQERYGAAQKLEHVSQYQKGRAEEDRYKIQQQPHSGNWPPQPKQTSHPSDSTDSSASIEWTSVNEVFPTPTSAIRADGYGMGQQIASYWRSNPTVGVGEWVGSPPFWGQSVSPPTATTRPTSGNYLHATNTSSAYTMGAPQNANPSSPVAEKYLDSHPHLQIQRGGHALLPPGAFDPRMRQIERQRLPNALQDRLSTPPIVGSYDLPSSGRLMPPTTAGMQIPKAVVTLSSPIDPPTANIAFQLYDNRSSTIAPSTSPASSMPLTEFTDSGSEGTLTRNDRKHLLWMADSDNHTVEETNSIPGSLTRTAPVSGLTPTKGTKRRASFRRDTWAFRPIQEDVLDHLQDFFPDHDLDKPFIDQIQIANEGILSDSVEALSPATSARSSRGSKLTHRKSIRVVAEERKKLLEGVGLSREPSAKSVNLGRTRSTKLWGVKVEEVTPDQLKHGVLSTFPESPTGTPLQPTIKWVKGELIGQGTYGRVFLALNVSTGEMMAVKQVEMLQTISDRDNVRQVSIVKALESEQQTLEMLDHPNVVQYLGFEKTREFFSVTSLAGQLVAVSDDMADSKKTLSSRSLAKSSTDSLICTQIRLFTEQDIKADNVLVDPSGNCKISDFGISKQSKGIYSNATMTAMQGSLFWMAPEMLHNDRGYNAKIDIWSLGCVFIEMLSGRRPWEQYDFVSVMFKVARHRMAPPVPRDVHLSAAANDFRLKCFAQDPDQRPTAEGLKGHFWLHLPPGWIFTGLFEDSSHM
ncbi:hypothetical protein FRC01_000760 [Tulasnella sp. 417]|nr:hypothetical protein FRC01_000760 [Tulasnella sp. 417]